MAKTVIIDEIHLTLRVTAALPSAQATVVRRTITSSTFMGRLRRACRLVVRAFPELAIVSVAVTR